MSALTHPDRLAALRATGLLDTAPEAGFDRLTRLATRFLGVPTSLVSLVDVDRQFFKSLLGLREPWATRRMTPMEYSFCAHAVEASAPFIVTDARADVRVSTSPAIEELGVVAYAGMPLLVHGQAIGAMCAIDSRPRTWSDGDLAVLEDLAAIAATEIVLRLAVQRLDETNQLVRSVLDTMEESVIVSDLDGNTVLFNRTSEQILQRASAAPGQRSPIIDHGMFEADGATPLPVERSPLARALAGERLRELEVRIRPPGGGDPDDHWHSVNASPLRRPDGSIRGAVVVGRDITQLKHAQQRLEEISIRDELTGLYNRRGFLEHARHHVALATRTRRPLALIYVDLDGLKAINDGLGHAMGDRAIREIAGVLAATFRSTDIVARLGGDELAVLVPERERDSDEPEVRARLAAALDAVNAAPDRPYRLAASVGVITYRPADGPRSVEDLLAEADLLMYEQKKRRRAGRDIQ